MIKNGMIILSTRFLNVARYLKRTQLTVRKLARRFSG
jgi:hypothetical protein